jgi:Nif11 domain
MTNINLIEVKSTDNTSNLEQFFQEVLSNTMLQNKLKEATDLESFSQQVVVLGEECGYAFSIEEVQADSAVKAAIGSLWENELDSMVKTIDFDFLSGLSQLFSRPYQTERCCM